MIRLKRKLKDDDFPADVCAHFKCEEPSGITLGAGVLRPFAVPLCDKHNAKRCAEEETENVAAAAEPTAESRATEDADARLAREAAWRAKVKAEKDGKAPEPDPASEELPPPPLEEFINAPLRDEPKPKPKAKADPKPTAESKPKAKPKSKPSGNGKSTIPIGVIKRALIGSGVSSAELSKLGQQQTEQWMADHLSEEDRQRVLDNARKMSRTPRVRPRQS